MNYSRRTSLSFRPNIFPDEIQRFRERDNSSKPNGPHETKNARTIEEDSSDSHRYSSYFPKKEQPGRTVRVAGSNTFCESKNSPDDQPKIRDDPPTQKTIKDNGLN